MRIIDRIKRFLSANTTVNIDKNEIQVFEQVVDYRTDYSGYIHEKGRIYVKWRSSNGGWRVTKMASPIIPCTSRCGAYTHLLKELIIGGYVSQRPIENLLSIKPHWHKEFKQLLKKYPLQEKYLSQEGQQTVKIIL